MSFKQLQDAAIGCGVALRDVNLCLDENELIALIHKATATHSVTAESKAGSGSTPLLAQAMLSAAVEKRSANVVRGLSAAMYVLLVLYAAVVYLTLHEEYQYIGAAVALQLILLDFVSAFYQMADIVKSPAVTVRPLSLIHI